MKVFTNINENIPKNCLATVGIFDGVHLGHKHLLLELKNKAAQTNAQTLIITLWPHPVKFFGNELSLLTTIEEKQKLLAEFGIDNLLILDFNKELAAKSQHEFVNDILVQKLSVDGILKGYNNSFGSRNKNDESKFAEQIPVYFHSNFLNADKVEVRSSVIRNELLNGDVAAAAKLLGYNYSIAGQIVSGYKIGRKIGFPTANLGNIFADKLVPANGVYFIKAHINNQSFPAMLNIGVRPSFDGTIRSIEFHIPEYEDDLYDCAVRIEFFDRLRNEKKFDNIDGLIKQLNSDKEQTKAFFNQNSL